MENPVEFDGLDSIIENDETDGVDPLTRLVDEGTERPHSDSKFEIEVIRIEL